MQKGIRVYRNVHVFIELFVEVLRILKTGHKADLAQSNWQTVSGKSQGEL